MSVSGSSDFEEDDGGEKKKEPPVGPGRDTMTSMLDTLPDDDDLYAKYDSPEHSSSGTKSNKSVESAMYSGESSKNTSDNEAQSHEESSKTVEDLSKAQSLPQAKSQRKVDAEVHREATMTPPLNPEDFIIKPRTNGSIMKLDSMELQTSFGYDCVNGNNLCVADENTLLYHCGHIIHMLNPYTKDLTFRWSSGKDGISYIAKNPAGAEIAIAEKGLYPDIVCYSWPEFNIISVLRGGAKHSFVCLDFSACGEFMVSQSREPDFLLTIWKWKNQQVYLSVKANNQDVYKTAFSPLDNNILVCCGLNHLKFWKIETTFTGMKMKGSYGKFGPADICDISVFIINKDNMLFSNCPWGNMFFWDGSKVKFEISRKESIPAHDGLITFFYCDPKENNVFTAGQDGKIRVWDYGKMLNTWPADNKPFEMQPTFERDITDSEGATACPVQLLPRIGVEDDYHFFLQDKNGGIWNVDLSLNADADPWSKVLETHAGPIVGLDVCPAGYYFATLGIDGKLLIYNNERKRVILSRTFHLGGSYLLWLPLELDPTASVLVVGFTDGTVRVVFVSIRAREFNPDDQTLNCINVLQAIKPHNRPVTYLVAKTKYDHHHVLSGSDDGTVFIYAVLPYYNLCQLRPLGFIKMPGPVTHIEFKKIKKYFIFLVSTTVATVSEVYVPEKVLQDTKEKDTYLLTIKYRTCYFSSVKSCVLRNLALKTIERKRRDKLEKKKEELARLMRANPGLAINEDEFFADSEEHEAPPELYRPPGKTRINFARYMGDNIWISPDGYDGGLFYEYIVGEKKPCRILDIPGTNRIISIQCCLEIYHGRYLLMGMSNGCIRVVKTRTADLGDLSEYFEVNMHLTSGHRITKLAVSYDNVIAYSCGTDGGVFTYLFNLPVEKIMEKLRLPATGPLPNYGILGIIAPDEPTLEEIKTARREENKRHMSEAIKMEMKEKVNEMAAKYEELIERNKKLPEKLRLPKEAFVISQRVDKAIIEKYNMEIDEFKKRHAYEAMKAKALRNKMYNACVKPIKTFPIYQFGIKVPASVCTFRELKLTKEFLDAEERTKAYLDNQKRRGRTVAQKFSDMAKHLQKQDEGITKEKRDAFTVIDRVGERLYNQGRLTQANLQLLNKITDSRKERQQIMDHYQELNALKEKHEKRKFMLPELGAHATSVEYKIKLNPEYRIPREQRTTLHEKYWEVLQKRRKMYDIKMDFNSQVKKLRQDKFELLRDFQIIKRDIEYLSEEAPTSDIVLPRTPNFNTELEFPEKLFMNTPPHCILDDPLPPLPKGCEQERKDLFGENEDFLEICREADMVNKYVNFTWLPGQMTYHDMISLSEIFQVHPWRADMIQRRHRNFRERINATSLSLVERIHEYDKEIKRLAYERIQYDIKLINTKLDLYFLLQELDITRGYQVLEESVKTKKNEIIKRKHIELLRMNIRKKKMVENNATVEKSNMVSNTIANQFLEVVKDNKYAKHLTRVFKKKYKPPRKKVILVGEDSSSSSCDEDFDDEVEGDDLQVTIGGAYLFDEKIRPDDCEQEIFQSTFKFRAERHQEEAKINEAKTQNLIYVKELETIRKTLLLVNSIIAIYHSQMDSFLKCKQEAYNKIWRVVVMKPSQIQHYNKFKGKFPPLSRCVVISAESIRKLVDKAEELETETESYNSAKYKCKDHVVRLKRDIAFMKKQCQDLKNEKKEEMLKKFGTEINMENLELAITNWIIKDAEQNAITTHRSMVPQMTHGELRVKRRQRILLELKKEETNQYHELFSIQEERNKINAQILNIQRNQRDDKKQRAPLDLKKYMESLEKELICQMAYKDYLLNQISFFKFKQDPHFLPKEGKRRRKKKDEKIPMDSIEVDVRNIVFDIVRRVVPSEPDIPISVKESVPEEEEVGSEYSSDESVIQEETPSKFAVDIIKEAIKGVIPSDPFNLKELEEFSKDIHDLSSDTSEDMLIAPPQSEKDSTVNTEQEEESEQQFQTEQEEESEQPIEAEQEESDIGQEQTEEESNKSELFPTQTVVDTISLGEEEQTIDVSDHSEPSDIDELELEETTENEP